MYSLFFKIVNFLMSCFSFQRKIIVVAFIMNSLPHVGQIFHVLFAINLVLMEMCCQCTLYLLNCHCTCVFIGNFSGSVWYFSIMIWCLFPCYTLSLKASRSSSPNAWKLMECALNWFNLTWSYYVTEVIRSWICFHCLEGISDCESVVCVNHSFLSILMG